MRLDRLEIDVTVVGWSRRKTVERGSGTASAPTISRDRECQLRRQVIGSFTWIAVPRYVPREDIDAEVLALSGLRTFCPYKGIALYYGIDGANNAAWSYRAPFDDVQTIGDLVLFEPDRVEVTLDGKPLKLELGQSVTAHGIDRNPDVDEAGAPTAAIDRGSSAFFSSASEGATREATS